MQLPPTILSLNNHKKKKEDSVATKAKDKKTGPPKAKSGANEKSVASLEPSPVQVPHDEGHETDSADESDGGGDAIMKDDSDILDETKTGVSASGKTNPPVVKALRRGTLQPPRTLEKTLFDRLEKMYGPGIKCLLNIQYRYKHYFQETPGLLTRSVPRMNLKIADFPSKVMYHNKLRAHKSVASHLLDDLPNTSAEDEEEAEEVLRTPVVFIDTAGSEYYERVEGDDGSRCNENEAMVVKKHITRLVSRGWYLICVYPKYLAPGKFRCSPHSNSRYHTVSVT